MLKFVFSYIKNESGATAIEYGLIAAGISLAIIASVFVFGDGLEGLYNSMGPALGAIPGEVETAR